MIIDCHGHYTTSPRQHEAWRTEQIAAQKEGRAAPPRPTITDDEVRESIVNGQLKLQQERGTDLTIFSPRAAGSLTSSAARSVARSRHRAGSPQRPRSS